MDSVGKIPSFTGMAIALLEDGTEASMDAVLGVIACAEESVYFSERYQVDEKSTSDALVEADLALHHAVQSLIDEYENLLATKRNL